MSGCRWCTERAPCLLCSMDAETAHAEATGGVRSSWADPHERPAPIAGNPDNLHVKGLTASERSASLAHQRPPCPICGDVVFDIVLHMQSKHPGARWRRPTRPKPQ